MNKTNYLLLRSSLRFDRPFLPTLAVLVFDAALLGCAVALLRADGLPSFLLSQLLLAVTFFNAFAVLHECGHGAASRHAWLNTLVGHLSSSFCLIPYYPWKYIHQKHHTWTGNLEHDPVLRSVRRWRDAGVPWPVRAAWRSWIPLGALIQHAVYMFYPLVMWRKGELTRAKLVRTVVSVVWLPASWSVFWLLAPDVVHLSNFALAILLFLIAEELVNIPHHVDMSTHEGKLPLWEQYRATRSCYYPPGISELLVLNFNFHTEHHLFPDLPWYRLRTARASLRAMLGEHYQEAIGVAWNIENRRRDLDSIVEGYRRSSDGRRTAQ